MALVFIVAPFGVTGGTDEDIPPSTSASIAITSEVKLDPALVPVCSCESSYEGTRYGQPRQFNPDGSVRRGKINPHDIGMCQINETLHGKEAASMGMDIYTTEGNIEFANYLYEHQGLRPWEASEHCYV